MLMQTKDGNFPSTSCATSQEAQESSFTGQSPISALKVTLLSSEWRSTKGGLSTINRELAIQLAKHSNVEVSMYLPQCSEEDKRAAAAHNVCIIEAEEIPGYDPTDWLATIPRDHQMDFVIGHGIHLGRQVPVIKEVHSECKWIQVVHTDPEELGMFKNYADSITKGAKKHHTEVNLCELADQVVAIGPKLAEAFSCYLRSSGKDQDVLNLTPGIFSEFADVTQAAEERGRFRVLVFGRGDIEDFYLKGCDIAARAVAELGKHEPHLFKLLLFFVGAPKGEEEIVKDLLLREGLAPRQLIVRCYKERYPLAAQFCEADLAIMPSRMEGFGLAALEALSAGLPVLVSGNSQLGDALKKLPFGSSCVVNSEDPSEWAKAIRTVHGKKRKLRLKEAVKVRESYAEKYHWEGDCGRLVERMLNIIQGKQRKKKRAEIPVTTSGHSTACSDHVQQRQHFPGNSELFPILRHSFHNVAAWGIWR
ncbi:PREDICTED: D-inositol 3-phosphate glycosyltransferase-like isoform X3 [Acropora digitifera]|uniref:D-inositol 3-phosphate glycosyltransferase-like isoform X3 n=1 Tax=Acropora digitifera TaxID=70779 RepID=UPI00077A4CFE|nr:PREDICTED: D-inositol 3-phosphate glycosyltransferase-like isoform X3 [Acropora digitifera]